MLGLFTGRKIPKGVSLPEDLWTYLERRRTNIGVSVSRQVHDALERDIYRQDHTTVDTKAQYITAQIPDGGR